jgi:hypothetical protein
MGAIAHSDLSRIVVSRGRVDPNAHWEFGTRIFHGAVHHYAALDANAPLPVPWWFILNVPRVLRKGGYVLLQAIDYPRTEAWTPVARTVINFAKATMQGYRGMLYAKIRLADPMGAQKYENVTWELRGALPPYLSEFTLRAKRKVATTRGSDGDSLVAVIPRDDHAQMIRLFFATKAWPLDQGLPAATRRALTGARRPAA